MSSDGNHWPLVVATHRYVEFVEPLCESAECYFHPTERTQVIVFTDKPQVPEGAWRVHQPHMPWPDATLLRYHIYLEHEALLREMDYVFCCDADMRFVDHVGSEVLGDRVATLHPGFFQVPRSRFAYETRPSSGACRRSGRGALVLRRRLQWRAHGDVHRDGASGSRYRERRSRTRHRPGVA